MSTRKGQAAKQKQSAVVMSESDMAVDAALQQAASGMADGTPKAPPKKKAQKNGIRKQTPLVAQGVDLGKTKDVQVPVAGSARLLKPGIEIVDGPKAMKKADELAFMDEMVEIVISESDNPNAENPVPVSINGRGGFIFRGQPTIVRRCYVERLARCKTDNFKQNLNETDPEKFNILKLMRGLKYPFTVTVDRNPKGRDWLIKVLREA